MEKRAKSVMKCYFVRNSYLDSICRSLFVYVVLITNCISQFSLLWYTFYIEISLENNLLNLRCTIFNVDSISKDSGTMLVIEMQVKSLYFMFRLSELKIP